MEAIKTSITTLVPSCFKRLKPAPKSQSKSDSDASPGKSLLGLPPALFYLYLASSFNTFILLTLSLLDLGYLSFWIIPPLSLFTFFSHSMLPFLVRAPRYEGSPAYFSTMVVCVYILALAWFVAFIGATTVAAMKSRWKWNLTTVRASGGGATLGTQVGQIVLAVVETALLATFAVKAYSRIVNEGEPAGWRPLTVLEDRESAGEVPKGGHGFK